ncbi:MAG: PAS domain S-box protein [bacterium]|nr:PAS domain S-box protein [bacterium]
MMKIKFKNLVQSRIFQIGIGVNLCYWLADAFAEYFFISERSLVEEIFHPSIHNFYSRIIPVIILFIFGVLSEIMTNRRRRMQDTLRESEIRLKTLFEKSAEAQLYLDQEAKIVEANAAFLNLFKFRNKSEVIALGPVDFSPEYQPEGTSASQKREEMLGIVRAQGTARLEWTHRKNDPDQTPIITEWICTSVHLAGCPMIHVSVRDITERKQAEEKLYFQYFLAFALGAASNLEEVLHLCLDVAIKVSGMDCGGIYLLNQDSGSMKLVIYQGIISSEFPQSVSEYDSQAAHTLLVMRGEPVYIKVLNQRISIDESHIFEAEGLKVVAVIPIKKEGKVIASLNAGSHSWVEIPPEARRTLETIAAQIGEVIARVQAQKELHRSEEKYRNLVESSTDSIVIVQEGKVVFCNGTSVKMFAVEKSEDIIGRSLLDFIFPAFHSLILQIIIDRGQELPVPNSYEIKCRRDDGTEFDVEATVSTINFKGQIAFQVVLRDITERRQAQDIIHTQRDLGIALSVTSDLAEALRLCLESAVKVSKMDSGGIYLMDDKSGTLDLVCSQGLSPDFIHAASHYDGSSPNAILVKKGGDIFLGKQDLPADGLPRREGLSSLAIIPILFEDQVIACFNVGSHILDEIPMISRYALLSVSIHIGNVIARIKAEASLWENEKKYRAMFEMSRDAIMICDREGFLDCNSATLNIFGCSSRDQFISKHPSELSPPTQPDGKVSLSASQERIEAAFATGVQSFEWIHRRMDGTMFPAEVSLSRIVIGGKQVIQAIVRDITERRRAEVALRESEEKYRTLVENIPASVAVLDLEGNVLFCNRASEEMTGYTVAEEIGMNVLDITPLEYQSQSWEALNKLMRDGSVPYFESMIRRKDGTLIPIETGSQGIYQNGKLIGIQNIFRDISERKRAEAALRESEEMYRTLVETSPDVIVVLDLEGRIRFASSRIYEVFGFESETDFMGKKVQNLNVDPEEGKRVSASINKATQEGSIRGQEYAVYRKDGRKIIVESRSSLLRDASGQPEALVVVVRDVTERERINKELVIIQKAVESSSDAIGMSDAQGRHFYQNQAFTNLFEYSVEELSDPLGAVAVFTKPEIGRQVFETIMRGNSWHSEIEMTAKNGRVIPVIGRADAIKDNQGKIIGLIGIFTDITERKLVETTLRESEDKTRLYFENVNDVIYSIDRDLRVVSISPSVERTLGYKPEEIIGKPFPELNLVAPESLEEALENVRKAYCGEEVKDVLLEFVGKNGKKYIGEVSASPIIKNGEVIAIIAVGRDVTERLRIEKELIRSESRYKSLVEETGTGIISIDLEGCVTFVNDPLCDLVGFRQAELLGRSIFEFIHPQDRDEVLRYFLLGKETPFSDIHFEYRVIHKNGQALYLYSKPGPIYEEGKVVGVISIVQDISERKIMEEALKKASDEWQVTFNSMNDAVALTDSNYRIVRANRAFSEIVGQPLSEIIGKPYSQTVDQSNFPTTQTLIDKGEYIEKVFIKSLNKHLVISITAILTNSRKISGIIIVIRDMTEETKLHESVRQVEKLAAVGEIAGGIAHEIKNPLFAISSGLQLLRETNKLKKGDEETLDVVFDSIMRVNRLINQLLVFGSARQLNITKFPIGKLIQGIVALEQGLLKSHGIKINNKVPANLPKINADFDRLNQVFTNILQNAIEFSKRGDTIEVRGEYHKDKKQIWIEIADQGPGIKPEHQDKIFSPFYTTKKEHSGLGLSISRKIVLDHSGDMWVEEREGGGSVFVVELPV